MTTKVKILFSENDQMANTLNPNGVKPSNIFNYLESVKDDPNNKLNSIFSLGYRGEDMISRWNRVLSDMDKIDSIKGTVLIPPNTEYTKTSTHTLYPTTETKVESTKIVIKEEDLTEYYLNHPLLKDREKAFIREVAEIEANTKIDSALNILKFGEGIQNELGNHLTKISETSSKMAKLDIATLIARFVEIVTEININNFLVAKRKTFFGKTEYWTVEDYIKKFEEKSVEVDKIIVSLKIIINDVCRLMDNASNILNHQSVLIQSLEAFNLSGKIIVEKNSEKDSKDHNEKFLKEQFERRMLELNKYESFTLLAIEQAKLTQQNLIDMAMNAKSIINTTYPLWKNTLASQITKWQSTGDFKITTPIKDLLANTSVNEAVQKSSEFINSLTAIKG